MKKILFEDALILSAIKAGRFIVRTLPLGVSFFIVRTTGAAIYRFSKRGRIAYKNVRTAFASEKPPRAMERIARGSVENLASSAVDLLGIPEMDQAYVHRHITLKGTEKFESYLKQGKGIIFLTAHFGSWELLNITAGLIGYPMLVLARTQKHPRSDAFLTSLRTSKGSQVITKGMPIREILWALKKGKIVGILGDQDAGRNGSFVRFFGYESSFAPGAAAFALKTHSPIFPVFIFRERALNHRVEVEGPLLEPDPALAPDEARRFMMQQFADILESKIRKSPDQWLWAHRRWKSTPDRSAVILSDQKAGHLNQSLAVLEAMYREKEKKGVAPERLRHKIIKIRFKNTFSKNLLKILLMIFGDHVPLKRRLLKLVLRKSSYREIISTYADVVISCGSALAGVNFLTKYENQAKSVVVMKPGIPFKLFDAVLVPWHDNVRPAANIFVTEGALTLPDGTMKAQAGRLALESVLVQGQKHIGLLVGGDTGRFKFERGLFERALRGIASVAQKARASILATSSRRTPVWADEVMEETFTNKSVCPVLVIPRKNNREGVVGAILGFCQLLVVSGESMSMVSEAVASGKRVVVFIPSNVRHLKKKHQAFLKRWQDKGFLILAKPGELEDVLMRELEKTSAVLNEVSRINREVLSQVARKVSP